MKQILRGVLIGIGSGGLAGLVETYLIILVASPPLQAHTTWSALHLLLVAIILNATLFGVVSACLVTICTNLQQLRPYTDKVLSCFCVVIFTRIVLSGYVFPLFITADSSYGRTFSNLFFLVITILLFWFYCKKIPGPNRKTRTWIPGLGAAIFAAGIMGTLSLPDITPRYRNQKFREPINSISNAPHVILILVDTLRSDHLSAYGYHRLTSPNIDRLAKEGVLFKQFRTHASWTIPSIATLFTSLHETVTGMHHVADRLPDSAKTLAETLRAKGYTTAFFSTNLFVSSKQNYTQGFDYISQLNNHLDSLLYRNNQPPQQLYFWRILYREASWSGRILKGINQTTEALLNESGADKSRWFKAPKKRVMENRITKADWVFREARGYLDHLFASNFDSNREKLFLYLHYFDPHDPYRPPDTYKTLFDPTFEGQHVASPPKDGTRLSASKLHNMIAQYDGEIKFFDHWLGRLIQYLKKVGLYDSSLILLTSDHGEAFYEHGTYKHGYTVFEEEIRVPLIIRLPNGQSGGYQTTVPAGLIDIMPSILDWLKIEGPQGMQGNSIVPALLGQHLNRSFYGEVSGLFGGSYQFTINEGKKYISEMKETLRESKKLSFKKGRLFDLLNDPKERRDLFNFSKKQTHHLMKLLQNERAQILERGRLSGKMEVEFDTETMDRLRKLGYIDD